ncbi:hypothetical protein AX769_11305 [Frondihabitans sp. PAMC 28766]|nr:hypothetical protein AX769_11305 [Frondihabitans sp. PAMC 28766]
MRTVLPVIRGVQVTRLHYSNVGRDHDEIYLELMVATTGSTVDSRTRCAVDEARYGTGEE